MGVGATSSRSPSAGNRSASSANDCSSAGNCADSTTAHSGRSARYESDDGASNEHDWAADANHDQGWRRGNTDHTSAAGDAHRAADNSGAGFAGERSARNASSHSGTGQRTLRAGNGNSAIQRFYRNAVTE